MDGKFVMLADEIEKSRQEGNVLVHCQKGISRAPCAIIAWLVKYRQQSVDESLIKLQKAKENVNPNIGFQIYLKNMENEQKEESEKTINL